MALPQRPRGNPAHWNSYRPNYTAQEQGPSTHPSGPPLPDTPPSLNYDGMANPNRISIVPRKRSHSPTPSPTPAPAPDRDDGPQLWPPSLDDLMGQTTRAYDLVINYAKDCPRGGRWTTESIKRIHEVGKHLHNDVGVLRSWKRQVHELGEHDEDMMRKISQDVEGVERLCMRVKRVIGEEENVPENQKQREEDGDVEMRDQTVEDGETCSSSPEEDGEADGYRTASHSPREQETPSRSRPQRSRRRGRNEADIWRPADSYRPGSNRSGIAGRLGRHILHY